MRESTVEFNCCAALKKLDPTVLAIKQTMRGYPDRLILMQNKCAYFIEFKTSKGKLSRLQEHTITQLRSRGHSVYVIRNEKEALRVHVAESIGDHNEQLRLQKLFAA